MTATLTALLRTTFLLALFFASSPGCGSESGALPDTDSGPIDAPDRGPLDDTGKDDNPLNTCEGFCGQKSLGACWCDDFCTSYDDCCDDKAERCDEVLNPKPAATVKINEVFYDPSGPDSTQVFIELFTEANVQLDGLQLRAISGADGDVYRTIELEGLSSSNGFFVVAHTNANTDLAAIAMQLHSGVDLLNGPDSLQLWRDDEKLDAVGYGVHSDLSTFGGETSPAVDPEAGASIGRDSLQSDTDNNAVDFSSMAPTPGQSAPCEDVCVEGTSSCADSDTVAICTVMQDGCTHIVDADECSSEGMTCILGACSICEPISCYEADVFCDTHATGCGFDVDCGSCFQEQVIMVPMSGQGVNTGGNGTVVFSMVGVATLTLSVSADGLDLLASECSMSGGEPGDPVNPQSARRMELNRPLVAQSVSVHVAERTIVEEQPDISVRTEHCKVVISQDAAGTRTIQASQRLNMNYFPSFFTDTERNVSGQVTF
ncbi:MAG: hypothetical protein JKY56_06375 [Kofleriaceae bacterium]|nr:hypothetical protein [Kofleriaceae bacterium]